MKVQEGDKVKIVKLRDGWEDGIDEEDEDYYHRSIGLVGEVTMVVGDGDDYTEVQVYFEEIGDIEYDDDLYFYLDEIEIIGTEEKVETPHPVLDKVIAEAKALQADINALGCGPSPWHVEGHPADEYAKLVVYRPHPGDKPLPPALGGVFKTAQYIRGWGWRLDDPLEVATPDAHISCWMDIPRLPGM